MTRCSVLPLGFTPRSYGDRLLVVGEAAGHIKPITCGGIYYGMLTGRIAAEVLEEALEKDRLKGGFLSVYEERWRSLLEEESRAGMMLRQTFRFTPDSVLDRMISLAGKHGIEKLIRDNADFDWHRNLIREVFRHSALGNLLGSLTSPGKDPLILNSTEALT